MWFGWLLGDCQQVLGDISVFMVVSDCLKCERASVSVCRGLDSATLGGGFPQNNESLSCTMYRLSGLAHTHTTHTGGCEKVSRLIM